MQERFSNSTRNSRSSWRGVREIRFVLGICLTIIQFDVDVARMYFILLEGEPYSIKVACFAERTESVESLSFGIIKVYPGPRGLCVGAARRQCWSRSKQLVRKLIRVFDKVYIARESFPARLKELEAAQNQDGIGLNSSLCCRETVVGNRGQENQSGRAQHNGSSEVNGGSFPPI